MKRAMFFKLSPVLGIITLMIIASWEASGISMSSNTKQLAYAAFLSQEQNAETNALTADVYQDMESGTPGDLLTPDIMEASSHGGVDGIETTWEIYGNLWVSTDYARPLPGMVTVNGTNYQAAGTHTWKFNDKYESNYAVILFGSLPRQGSYLPYHDRITIAGYYTPGQTNVFWNQHDTITTGGNETFSVLQTIGEQGGPYIRAHSCTQPGWETTFSPNWIKVEAGKTYWVNLHHDGPAGEVKVAVFDPDNDWAQVGETVVAESVPGSTVRSRIRLGRADAHGDNNSWPNETFSYFGQLMIDYTNAAFPLLPPPATAALELHGTPDDQAIHLDWDINVTSPFTGTWHIDYYTTTASIYTETILSSTARSTTLTEHIQNHQLYTITLKAMLDETAWLSDTVQVMPTDKLVYLPLVLK